MNFFIHSYLLLLKQEAWKCKRKCIFCQFSVLNLLWHECYFGMDCLAPFLDLTTPPPPSPLSLTRPLICKICKFFQLPPPVIQYFEISKPTPFVTGGGGVQTMALLCLRGSKTIRKEKIVSVSEGIDLGQKVKVI